MLEITPTQAFGDYLTVAEAAEFLGVSPWTLRNWDNVGKLKPDRHPINGYRMYRREDLEALLAAGSLLGRKKGTLAPNFDWGAIGSSEHFVQFYETDAYLVESVATFLFKGLRANEAAIVIATDEHRKRIEKKLNARGLDVAAARQRGQYVALDAAEALGGFMAGDMPDPELFAQSVGAEITKLAQDWPGVRAFGEMVALLWEEGKRAAACRLEELWTDLGKRCSFALFCGYPISGFVAETDATMFAEICGCHSRVVPAESYASLATSDQQLRAISLLQQKAAALEAEVAQREQIEREFSDFLENAVVGLHRVGPDGTIIWANKTELELLGYNDDEYIGRHIREFHVDPEVLDDVLARLKRGETVRDQAAQMRCKDGTIRDVLINANALFERGKFIHSRCFTRDVTELNRAQEAQAKLAAIVASSQDAIVSKTLDGVIQSWNAGAERLFGYSAAEAVGRSITLIIPPELHDQERTILERLRRGERVGHFDTERICKDGRRVQISLSISPVRDRTGRIIGASKVARDITERKHAEERLRLGEERYRRLTQLLPVGVYTCEAPSGVITYYNDQAARLWGRAPMLGDTDERFCGSFKLFTPDGGLLPHVECPMSVALSEGREFRNQEVIIERPDGSRITVLVNIDPIRDESGHVVGAVNVFHDMTALKETERALREQKESLQTLLDTLPVPVLIAHDSEGKRISGNRPAATLLRMPPDANFSKSAPRPESPEHFRVLRNGKELPPEALPVQRAARGEIVRAEEVAHEFTDGTISHALVSAQPLYEAPGRPRGAVACLLDITELRNAETALREADRRKDEFLATLAHELRNPLAPIRNCLRVLRMASGGSGANSAVDRAHEVMERQVAHMVRLIDDLLELSRISRGTIELKKERVELATVINHAVETSKPLIEAAGHRLTVALAAESVRVNGDPVRLSQVFANLLNNAAKYTERGGEIALTAKLDGGEAVVSVRDTGIGIARNMLARVFDMFAQVPNSLRRSQDGLGIGLSLVRTLVAMHGGCVTAHSEGIGQGSEFVVRLPISDVAEQASKPEHGQGAAGPAIAPMRRILIVDDNRDAADSLAMLLRFSGADVHVAYDGASALESIRICRPAVVFLDLGMPGIDGYEVARRVRQNPEHEGMVLIALTGWGQESNRRSSQEAGFNHHLVKPVDFGSLQAVLASAEGAASPAAAVGR